MQLSQTDAPLAYYMYGADLGDLFVDIDTGGVWTNLFALTGQQQIGLLD